MSLSRNLWLRARNSRREDFLSASQCVVPKWMGKMIIYSQPLIVTDKLRTIVIDRRINNRIPALGGHTDILEKRCAMIDGLRQVHINQPVLGIEACIIERYTDYAIWCNSKLWLKLIRSIAKRIVIYPDWSRPGLSMIFRGGKQDIRIPYPFIRLGEVELPRG
jgi:hypothetical protein